MTCYLWGINISTVICIIMVYMTFWLTDRNGSCQSKNVGNWFWILFKNEPCSRNFVFQLPVMDKANRYLLELQKFQQGRNQRWAMVHGKNLLVHLEKFWEGEKFYILSIKLMNQKFGESVLLIVLYLYVFFSAI